MTYSHVVWFALGEAALIVALVSPLDALGGTLLSAHMIQHGLLIGVAPLLLLVGRPGVAFAWALPADARKKLLGSRFWRSLASLANTLSRPLPATTLCGLALWVWHAPGAFEAALQREWLHTFEHAAFFGTGLLFWRAVWDAGSSHHVGQALGAAFLTLMQGGLLGGLITLAPVLLYGWYRDRSELWGLTPLEDQQLAGLIMWVPMSVIYFALSLVLARGAAPGHARAGRHCGENRLGGLTGPVPVVTRPGPLELDPWDRPGARAVCHARRWRRGRASRGWRSVIIQQSVAME